MGGETLTAPRYGGVLVGPEQSRLWLIVGAPQDLEFPPGEPDATAAGHGGVRWPPKG